MKVFKSKAFLGALCILLAAVIAFAVLPRFYKAQAETTYVVRATQDVPEGTELTKGMLTLSEVGAYGLSEKVVRSEEEAVGQIAAENLFAGEYLMQNRVISVEEYAKRTEAKTKGLGQGNCLVTLKFPTASSGLAGVLRAGNIVDVYECREDEEKNVAVWKILPAMYVYSVLNQDLEPLDELDEKKEQALEDDTDYDFEPAYVVFRCTEEQAITLIRLEKQEALHLTLARTGD